MGPVIIISCDRDGIGRVTGEARLRDDVEGVRRIDQAIGKGQKVLESWALSTGGSVIEAHGDEVCLELPAAALADLPGVRKLYHDATGATLSVGVGKTLSQSAKALLAAKLRGRDQVVLYGDDVEQEVAAASEKPGLSAGISKRVPEPTSLVKAEGSAAGTADHGGGVSKPGRAQPHHQAAPGPAAPAAAAPELTHAAADFEKQFRAHADTQEQADRAHAARASEDMEALRAQVAEALQALRAQLPVLGQIKQAYPETYRSVMGLVQSVVTLARGLRDGDDELAKKEQGAKVWRSTGWGTDVVTIPSAAHPQRDAYDKAYLEGVAHQYAGGDPSRLKALKVPVAKLVAGNSGRGIHNKDRFSLYRRMYAAGDQAPPLVVQRTKTGYQILDGTHRYEAAKAAGVTHVRAVELHKSEPLTKDIGSIAPGRAGDVGKRGGPTYDYSHVLKPEHVQQGYSLKVQTSAKLPGVFSADLYHHDSPVGAVNAFVWDPNESRSGEKAIEPHSDLHDAHHGRGLGKCMYEAAYAHAKHFHGVTAVEGGRHSDAARHVHEALARKHGFEYKTSPDWSDNPDFPNGAYNYALKAELESAHEKDLMGPGRGLVFHGTVGKGEDLDKGAPDPSQHARGAPVGTLHNGKLKVQHADGDKGWKGVRAGMIQGLEPGGIGGGGANSHAVSSREPSSR